MICAHGQLSRQCELCDRDREIERLREQLADVERASREAWRFANEANAERAKMRAAAEEARRLLLGMTELRGIYAPPEVHRSIKEAARKIVAAQQKKG